MSSSESEDENLKRFAESLDVTVFSNKLYNKADGDQKEEEPKVELKSQRELESEENIFKSEINVSSTMQKFIGQKMSNLIDQQIEFVEVGSESQTDDDQVVDNVRLLGGSKEVVKYIHEAPFVENRKKVPIKRRRVEEEPNEVEKCKDASIDKEGVQEDVKRWDKKTRHQPIEYKNLKGIGYLREHPNEFAKMRNKNNWTEAKIKSSKYHNEPLSNAIKR
jgi:hypothetical protein